MTQISRITTWANVKSLTAPTLNNEFNNILNIWNNTDAGLLSWSTLSVTGATTFASAITITPTSNQIVLGATRTVTLTAPTPASASRTWTIPDISADGTFAALQGTQTFTGAKTFSSAIAITATSSHIALSTSSNTLTIQANAQATSARTWSVPDVSGNGTFAALEGTQTFTGSKTFSSTSGNPLHGNASNTAPSAGFVGEVITSVVSTPTNDGGSTVWTDLTSIVLTAGHWLILGNIDFILNTATAVLQHNLGISTTTGNSSSGLVVGDSRLLTVPATANTDTSCTIAGLEALLNGSATYYLKFMSIYSTGVTQSRGRITAVRIS